MKKVLHVSAETDIVSPCCRRKRQIESRLLMPSPPSGVPTGGSSKRLFYCPYYAHRTPHVSKSAMCRCAEEKHSAWPKGNGCARVLPQAINRELGLMKVDTVRDRLVP